MSPSSPPNEPPLPGVEFALRAPSQYSGTRALRDETEFEVELSAAFSSADQGRFLADLLFAVQNADSGEWQRRKLAAYIVDPMPSSALFVIASASRNPEVAAAFVARLSDLPQDPLQHPALAAEDFRTTALLRSMNRRLENPQALAILADRLTSNFSDEQLGRFLSQRRLELRQGGPTGNPEVSLGQLDNFLNAFSETERGQRAGELVQDERRRVAQSFDEIYEQQGRSKQIESTKRLAAQCRTNPTVELVTQLIASAAESSNVDAPAAMKALISGLSAAAGSTENRVAHFAERELRAAMEAIAPRVEEIKEHGSMPWEIQTAAQSLVSRDLKNATVVEDGWVKLNEERMREIGVLAEAFGVPFDNELRRRSAIEHIPRRQAELDQQLIGDVDVRAVPPGVIEVRVETGTQFLTYSDVEELIADLKERLPWKGRTADLVNSLSEQLRAWHHENSGRPFRDARRDEFTYQYLYDDAVNTIHDHSFLAEHDDDGNIRFTIAFGNYEKMQPYMPTGTFDEFARFVNKSDKVEYLAPPRLHFTVGPRPEVLSQLTHSGLGAFRPPKQERLGTDRTMFYRAETPLELDLAAMSRFTAAVTGADAGLSRLAEVGEQFANEATNKLSTLNVSSVSISRGTPERGIEINVPLSANRETRIRADGKMTQSGSSTWHMPVNQPDEIQLLAGTLSATIRMNDSDTPNVVAARRANAFTHVVNRQPPLTADSAPGWRFSYGSLALPLSAAAPTVQEETRQAVTQATETGTVYRPAPTHELDT